MIMVSWPEDVRELEVKAKFHLILLNFLVFQLKINTKFFLVYVNV